MGGKLENIIFYNGQDILSETFKSAITLYPL